MHTVPNMIPPVDGKLNRKKLFWCGGILGMSVVIWIGYQLVKSDPVMVEDPKTPPATETSVRPGSQDLAGQQHKLTYVGQNRLPQVAQAQMAAPPREEVPPAVREQTRMQVGQMPQIPQATGSGTYRGDSGQQVPVGGGGQGGSSGAKAVGTAGGAKEKPPPRRYMFAPSGNGVGRSPFDPPVQPGSSQGALDDKKGTLIKPANWERPIDPDKVWYISQGLEGVTTTEINSNLPGQIIIRVTRDLTAKSLSGAVLIPQHSMVVARQTGQPDFTGSRLPVTVRQIEPPDMSIIGMTAQVGDRAGAAGIAGDVDYHLLRVAAAAGISAFLSIGARVPTGNQQGFAPSLGQQVTSQVGNDIASTGNQVVKRALDTAPTMHVPATYPVTIHPEDNISFSQKAKAVR